LATGGKATGDAGKEDEEADEEESGIGRDQRFWTLSDCLSTLYPTKSDEKRWVDGVLARKKGLGL